MTAKEARERTKHGAEANTNWRRERILTRVADQADAGHHRIYNLLLGSNIYHDDISWLQSLGYTVILSGELNDYVEIRWDAV